MVQQGEPWLHTECRSCQFLRHPPSTARSPPFPSAHLCIPVLFPFFFSLPSASFPPFFPSFLPFFHSFPSFLSFFFPLPPSWWRRATTDAAYFIHSVYLSAFSPSPKTVTVVVARFIVPAFRVAPRNTWSESKHGKETLDPVNTHLRGTNGGEYRSRLKNKLKDPPLVERPPSVPPILSLHPLFHVSQCLPSSALHPRSFDISSTRQGGQISRTRYLSFRRLRCRYGGRKGYAPGLIYPIPGVSSTLLLNGGSEGNNSSDNSKIFA